MKEKVLVLVYVTMKGKEAINLRMRGHGRGVRSHGGVGDRVIGSGRREENDKILLYVKCIKDKTKRDKN